MNLFSQTVPPPTIAITKQIEKIRSGMIQRELEITPTTTSADKARILMIRELQNEL